MSERDNLKLGRDGLSTCLADRCSDVAQLTAKDVMQYGIVSIDRNEPVHRAVALLIDKGISGLPVTQQGRLCGILSERDLLRLVHKQEYLPGTVGDYMRSEVVSFDVDDPVSAISELLVGSSFRHVPILLNKHTPAGMITRADLIRMFKDRFRPSTPDAPSVGRELLAEDVMSFGLLTLPSDAPLCDAMEMIARYRVTGLPVVDEVMHLLGMITEKDVLGYCLRPFPAETTVAAFMTTDVVAFDRKAPLDLICECLIEKDFHRVPIVDGGRLIGIISRSDILKSRAAVFKR